mmetsp:Transcript_17735/g.23369  ORF Transcript_17735/g.23369 Transcript_17735/m.23369 type:complete len:110 (-) Transcript_17735:1818-2147(-)
MLSSLFVSLLQFRYILETVRASHAINDIGMNNQGRFTPTTKTTATPWPRRSENPPKQPIKSSSMFSRSDEKRLTILPSGVDSNQLHGALKTVCAIVSWMVCDAFKLPYA